MTIYAMQNMHLVFIDTCVKGLKSGRLRGKAVKKLYISNEQTESSLRSQEASSG